MRWLGLLAALLVASAMAQPGPVAKSSGAELAARMDLASHTEGFRLRAQIERVDTGESWRVFMAGEKDPARQRLLLRLTAPDTLRGQGLVLTTQPGQALHAVQFGTAGAGARPADAAAPWLGSGIVPWDFSGQWWQWPQQTRIGEDSCLAQRCEVLDSRVSASNGVVRVRSWYAPALNLTLRLEFYAADGQRLRELRVTSIFRRADGSAAARTLTLTDAAGSVWRMNIYNGEEGVRLAPDTFEPTP